MIRKTIQKWFLIFPQVFGMYGLINRDNHNLEAWNPFHLFYMTIHHKPISSYGSLEIANLEYKALNGLNIFKNMSHTIFNQADNLRYRLI